MTSAITEVYVGSGAGNISWLFVASVLAAVAVLGALVVWLFSWRRR